MTDHYLIKRLSEEAALFRLYGPSARTNITANLLDEAVLALESSRNQAIEDCANLIDNCAFGKQDMQRFEVVREITNRIIALKTPASQVPNTARIGSDAEVVNGNRSVPSDSERKLTATSARATPTDAGATPRTDAFYLHSISDYEQTHINPDDSVAWIEFARRLERELAEEKERSSTFKYDLARVLAHHKMS